MIKIVNSLEQVKFSELMCVYSEAIRENGETFYPKFSVSEQIYEAEQDFYRYLKSGFFCQKEAGVDQRLVALMHTVEKPEDIYGFFFLHKRYLFFKFRFSGQCPRTISHERLYESMGTLISPGNENAFIIHRFSMQ